MQSKQAAERELVTLLVIKYLFPQVIVVLLVIWSPKLLVNGGKI